MAMEPILAMTAAEMSKISSYPPKIAWMACHFSPYGLGLSNLPADLPPGALLMLDDITPPHGHDLGFIGEQLTWCVERFRCCGVLLDFQRPGSEETASIAKHLTETLACPCTVSECYGQELDCPVFLPPVPPSVPLEEYLTPWKGRDIWLELGLVGEILTLTEAGCEAVPFSCQNHCGEGFADDALHCHYTIDTNEKAARFTLWRTKDDLNALLAAAETIGITSAVGLYQELR